MGEPLANVERAVLLAISDQYPEHKMAIQQQLVSASVLERTNTGVGFYITFTVEGGSLLTDVNAPLGAVLVDVVGLERGLAFLLWPKDGRLGVLEGHVWGEETAEMNLCTVEHSNVRPERTPTAH